MSEPNAKSKWALRGYFESNRIALNELEGLPLTILNTFIGVCIWGGSYRTKEPMDLGDLSERVGLPLTTISRHMRYLDYTKHGSEKDGTGLGLIRTEINPQNRRKKMVLLTEKGERLRDRIVFALGQRDDD